MALLAAKVSGQPLFDCPVTMHLDFYLCRNVLLGDRYYPLDEDNATASFKAGQDALKQFGVIREDNKNWLRKGRTRLFSTKAEHQGRSCVVVTLEPILQPKNNLSE